MHQDQDHQHEGEEKANGMTDAEKIDKSNILFKELKKIKEMELFGLNEGDNKLLLSKLRKTQKSVRDMIEFQYQNYEAHIPYPKAKAPNPELLKLREDEQFIKGMHKQAYDRLGKAMKNFRKELEERCQPKTDQMRTTIENQVNADFMNMLIDSDLTYQETVGAMFMQELEDNKDQLDKKQYQFSVMAQMYKNMSKEVKKRKQIVNELLQAKKIIDKNQQLL